MKIALAAACLGALALAGCNSAGQLTPQAQADVAKALADGCPFVISIDAAVSAGTISLNRNEQGALTILDSVCPPNPPPTDPVAASGAVIAAVAILQPLLAKHK